VHLYALSLLKVKTVGSAAANYDSLDMKSSAKAMLGVTLRQLLARQCQAKTKNLRGLRSVPSPAHTFHRKQLSRKSTKTVATRAAPLISTIISVIFHIIGIWQILSGIFHIPDVWYKGVNPSENLGCPASVLIPSIPFPFPPPFLSLSLSFPSPPSFPFPYPGRPPKPARGTGGAL